MARTALALLVIGGVCGILLAGTAQFTATDIARNREARARMLMSDMLGNSLPADLDIAQPAFGDCAEWVFQRVRSSGYAGPIEVLVLWRASADTLVLRVTGHRETPGIGDFIDHARSPWITAFDNKPLARFVAADNVSGATVTSAAMRRAAQSAQQQIEAFCAG